MTKDKMIRARKLLREIIDTKRQMTRTEEKLIARYTSAMGGNPRTVIDFLHKVYCKNRANSLDPHGPAAACCVLPK